MIQQFYISTTALSAYQKMMINITNDVSNAQTPGYKGSRVELEALFPGILEEEMVNSQENSEKKDVYYGAGVKIADVIRDFRQGRVEITGKPLDVAINGDGFLQFRLPDGSVGFGRAGNLQKDRNGYLTDPNGNLLDPPIRIPSGTIGITIDQSGRVFTQQTQGVAASNEVGQIMLARFDNPNALQSIGQNLYLATSLSGQARSFMPSNNGMGIIQQNALELSNVNVVNEMMKMVIVQRSFSLAAKAISAGEDMLKAAEDIAKGS